MVVKEFYLCISETPWHPFIHIENLLFPLWNSKGLKLTKRIQKNHVKQEIKANWTEKQEVGY